MCSCVTSNGNQKCVNKLGHVVLYSWEDRKMSIGFSGTMVADEVAQFLNGRTR